MHTHQAQWLPQQWQLEQQQRETENKQVTEEIERQKLEFARLAEEARLAKLAQRNQPPSPSGKENLR